MKTKVRRRSFVAATLFAALAFAVPASAVGPGGWEHVGGGLNDTVRELNTDAPGQLLVGGRFTDAGGNSSADRIASWNGTSWSSLGPADSLPGGASSVHAIAYFNGKVYAGGTFGDGGGPGPDNLAVWDGVSWQQFCATVGGPVDALEVIGSTIYVGGAFSNVNADPAADNLIACNLTTDTYIGPTVDNDGDVGGRIQALVADASGNLYAGGTFINMDGILPADYVARFDGSGWHTMGTGPGGPTTAAINTANVDALATDGTNVYVGTDDDDVAGIPQADHVARWNGSAWSAVGSNAAGGDGYFPAGGLTAINALLASGANLYATGSFNNAGGDPLADHVAIFNGTSWDNMGSDAGGTNGAILGTGNALAFFNGSPTLGGGFTNAGDDVLADRIAAFPLPPDPTPPPGPDIEPPAPPVLTGTSPASPSIDTMPRVIGSAEPGTVVRLHQSADTFQPCGSSISQPLAIGTSDQLASPGIAVNMSTLAPHRYFFAATATDAAGNTSACSSQLEYGRMPVARIDEAPRAKVVIRPKKEAKLRFSFFAGGGFAQCRFGKGRAPLLPRPVQGSSGQSPQPGFKYCSPPQVFSRGKGKYTFEILGDNGITGPVVSAEVTVVAKRKNKGKS